MSGGLFTPGGLAIPQSYGAGYASGRMGVAIAPSTTASAKGGWVEITASATGLLQNSAAILLKVYISNLGKTSDFAWAVDIGLGTNSANIQVIVPNLCFGNHSSSFDYWTLQLKLPIALPAGTHIWARSAGVIASPTTLIQVALVTYDSGFADVPDCCAFDALGVVSTGLGTTIATTSGGTATAWVSFGTAVRDYVGLFLLVNPGANAESRVYLDVAIGSPQNIILPLVYVAPISGTGTGFNNNLLPVSIPLGSAIYVRGYNLIGVSDSIQLVLYAGYK